ncbi:hypothetical protein [Microbacterium sp. H1-D42]|uniref:hypothetical protein n=1 Tax=Microbacterium sp. H1-D42 TaxID=2925844 RepID=UPI001F534728|nr:hypothetical protein [Microbacterium sp. H1-D42]UNK70607.1 hypothetical protein MNR00_15825 [Microbacterium sp. H1-D42]
MYEHPCLIHRVGQIDLERQEQRLERARIAKEHPERLVARRSWMDRMLHRSHPVALRAPAVDPAAAVDARGERAACAAVSGRVASEVA